MYVRLTGDTASYYTLTDLRRDNPEVSWPAQVSDDLAAEFGVYPCAPVDAPATTSAQRADLADPVFADGQWHQRWIVVDLTAGEIAEQDAATRAAIKAQAAALLSETDYLDLPNTAARIGNLGEILAYREALRSLAINPPLSVDVWPVRPATVWTGL